MTSKQRIVITGGSSGLGLALAERLAARGDAIALMARNPEKLAQAASSIRQKIPDATVTTMSVDVSEQPVLSAAFSEVTQALGGIDLLINSAGILRESHFDKTPLETHREVMEINYFGSLYATLAALPYIEKSSRGQIVNISSLAGMSGVFGYSAYCASKHALLGLSETLRVELAPRGIKVQVVCPGEFDSPMVDDIDTYRSPENLAHAHTIPKVSLDVVVEDTLKGMDSSAFMIIPGRTARMAAFGVRHFPGISRRVGDRIIAQAQKKGRR